MEWRNRRKNLLYAGFLVVFFKMGVFRRISFETNLLIWTDQMANILISRITDLALYFQIIYPASIGIVIIDIERGK
ncbi:hypothetical protein COJ96_17970 [Bacillus sp. AFS073361]|nr:hypothetical protein COJ96_17970 [Bacillus sp. AFS073361]